MKLGDFIKKLEKIADEHGTLPDVVMADNILVINPVYAENYPRHKKVVVITDQR